MLRILILLVTYLFTLIETQLLFLGSGRSCGASCELGKLPISNLDITCYDRSNSIVGNVPKVEAGGYCILSCDDKPGTVT